MEETKEPDSASSASKDDVSFNTLLDDSNMSFNPDTAATSTSSMTAAPTQQPISEGASMTKAMKPTKKELS